MTELDRHRLAVNLALVALQDLCGAENRAYTGPRCNKAIEQINNILHSEPEYEEVEVVRWFNPAIPAYRETEPVPDQMDKWVKLTGTLRRPKPQKVERSVSVVAWVVKDHVCYLDGSVLLDERASAPLMESYPETHGKQGLLTFTWTEEGDGK